ncbi:MAG: hypothetical protein K0R54_5195 [Clostridiaceae bacterium]|jgi:hypothetical protein|nr:hypothetical protein [Clostridiaceae bacterium]
MNEQIKINENMLTINNINVRFDHNIRNVKICRDLIIVLLISVAKLNDVL